MKFLLMKRPDQDALYVELEGMPEFLTDTFGGLSAAEASASLSADSFSPVEQCWHLADLEREAFSVRIRRLLEESNPWLEDFDGARVARERKYKEKSLSEGIAAFRKARLDNIALLKKISPDAWTRQGDQEGVGRVMLCDIPSLMAEHDTAHREEIEAWLRADAS
jgi:hypothetical protein